MYTTRSKGNTHYHLVISNWPDARGKNEVDVGEQEFQLTDSGCIGVVWHAGRLGDGWISGYEAPGATRCDLSVE